MNTKLHRLPVILTLVLASVACHTDAPAGEVLPESPPVLGESSASPAEPTCEVIGHSVEGRPIELARFGSGPTTILALATIHGDESAGTPLLTELVTRLAASPDWLEGRRVLVVPVCNPDGFAQNRRFNASRIDLNRNFPASNHRPTRLHGREPLSEPESRALHALILAEQPDCIVSIHQAANCIDYDGPARGLAERIAAAGDLPLEVMGARPGSLGSFAGVDLGIPTLTIELPGSASALDGPGSWERYGEMLRVAIRLTRPVGEGDQRPYL